MLERCVERWFEASGRRKVAAFTGSQNELASNTKLSIDKRPPMSLSVVFLRLTGEEEVDMK